MFRTSRKIALPYKIGRAISFAVLNAIYLPDGKCDIAAAQLRYDINPLTRRSAYRIEDISHRIAVYRKSRKGFISLLTKNADPKVGILLLAISP